MSIAISAAVCSLRSFGPRSSIRSSARSRLTAPPASAPRRIAAGDAEERDGITPRDLLTAEMQIVPATAPRDVGLDRALVGAYGQDDRASAYISLRAIAEVKTPRYT